MRYRLYSIICLLACLVAFPVMAQDSDLLSIEVSKHQETITISARDVARRKVFLLPKPDRLVVDIPSLRDRPNVALPTSYHGKLISKVRIGQFDPATSRLVFELSEPVSVQKVHDGDSGQLIIDIAPAQEKNDSAQNDDNQDSGPFAFFHSKPGKAEVNYKAAVEDPSPAPTKKSKKSNSKKPSKPQKPIIVIDAGHGGQDPGTSGPSGTEEKDVVLDYAHALKARLLKSGHYQVVLTRDDDEFIMLRKRVDIARKAGANLFISLHADSAPDYDARGLSVYTVSEKSSDMEAEALAARENKADVIAGMNLSDEREDVAGILISLAERETKNRSATFADMLVTSLDDKVPLLSNSHRFAGFAVLKAPDVPSVLIEIGFLSHPSEEKLLKSKAYRDKVTSGIAAGIDSYFHLEKSGGDQ